MAIWLASLALSILLVIMLTMSLIINKHSGFRPYATHAAWAVWLFVWMLLVWWRSPLLVSDGWGYHHLFFISIGPLLVGLAWGFIAPAPTEGSAEAARDQYFEKAPQAFRMLTFTAVWAIVMNAWLGGGADSLPAIIGWTVALVAFIAVSRSSNPRLHAGVAVLAWIVIIAEFIFELSRGVPSL